MRMGAHDEIDALIKRGRNTRICSLCCVKVEWKAGHLQVRKRVLRRTKSAGTWILDFSASITIRNGCLLFRPSRLWYCVIEAWADEDTPVGPIECGPQIHWCGEIFPRADLHLCVNSGLLISHGTVFSTLPICGWVSKNAPRNTLKLMLLCFNSILISSSELIILAHTLPSLTPPRSSGLKSPKWSSGIGNF